MTRLKQLVTYLTDKRMDNVYTGLAIIMLLVVFYFSLTTKPPNLGHWCHNYIGVRFSPDGKMHPICLNCLRDMDEVKMQGVPVKDL
jgi:hypothetical protein